jgi:hypothetical protein
MKIRWARIFLVIFFMNLVGQAVADEFSLSYSGRLIQDNGMPVSGPIDFQVEFLHGETILSVGPYIYGAVEVTYGAFALDILLSGTDLNVIFPSTSQKVHIRITDLTNGRIFPKQLFETMAFALRVPVDGETIHFNDDGNLKAYGTTLKAESSSATLEVRAHANTPAGTVYTYPATPDAGKFLKVNAQGEFAWDTPLGSGGDITGVSPGTGLEGGGSSGDISLSLKDSGVAPGTYPLVIVDSKGRVTGGSVLGTTDVPDLDAAKITSGSFGTARIDDNAITSPKILNAAVTASKMSDGAVVSSKIADSAVTDAKIATGISASKITGLGGAALLDVGTAPAKVVQLDGLARLPAVDGSRLTNLPGQNYRNTNCGPGSQVNGFTADGTPICGADTDNAKVIYKGTFTNQSEIIIETPFISAHSILEVRFYNLTVDPTEAAPATLSAKLKASGSYESHLYDWHHLFTRWSFGPGRLGGLATSSLELMGGLPTEDLLSNDNAHQGSFDITIKNPGDATRAKFVEWHGRWHCYDQARLICESSGNGFMKSNLNALQGLKLIATTKISGFYMVIGYN